MNINNMLQPSGRLEYYDLEPLIDDIEPATNYPIETLPKFMRDAVLGIAEFIQAPIALAGQSVLGAAVYLAQARVDAWTPATEDGQMPCSVFMLALGDSGDRKSSVHNLAFAPIRKVEETQRRAYEAELSHIEKASKGLTGKELASYEKDNPQPCDPTTIISSDGSYSRLASMFIEGTPSLFWNSDEGAQMLGSHSMKSDDRTAVIGGLMKWLDDGSGQRLRSRSNADGSGTAYNRRLSINLLAQEIAVRSELSDPILRGQGFLPRFLFSAPDTSKGSRLLSLDRLDRKAVDDPRINSYWEYLQHLMNKPKALNPNNSSEVMAPVLQPNIDAKLIWLSFYNTTETAQKRFGDYAELAPFASRAGEIALRLATVLAFFNQQNHVDAEAMQAAVALTDHSLQEWKRYACTPHVDKNTQLAVKVIDWLTERVNSGNADWLEFSGRQWSRNGYNPIRSARLRDSAFAILLEKKHLLTDGTNYRINPKLISINATSATLATGHQSQAIKSATPLRQAATPNGVDMNVATCRTNVAEANPANSNCVAQVANVATAKACEMTI